MIPTPAELHYFHEIALAENISVAARKLQISQPSLSMAMKRLEKNMGTMLLVRHKKGVTLTPSGKKFHHQIKPLLLHWENTKQESLALHQEAQGEVTIGCHSTVALFLHQILPDLLTQYPKLSFHLQHDVSQNTTTRVINSLIDIGVVVNPLRHPDLIIKKIHTMNSTLWQSTIHASKKALDSQVIICDPNFQHTHYFLNHLKKIKLSSMRTLTSNSLEVAANLTVHGCGFGILPSCFIETIYPNQLRKVPNMPICSDNIYLIYRKENKAVKAVTIMIEAIKKFIGAV